MFSEDEKHGKKDAVPWFFVNAKGLLFTGVWLISSGLLWMVGAWFLAVPLLILGAVVVVIRQRNQYLYKKISSDVRASLDDAYSLKGWSAGPTRFFILSYAGVYLEKPDGTEAYFPIMTTSEGVWYADTGFAGLELL